MNRNLVKIIIENYNGKRITYESNNGAIEIMSTLSGQTSQLAEVDIHISADIIKMKQEDMI